MAKLERDELALLDKEIIDWGQQGFVDIAIIVDEDHLSEERGEDPVLAADDIIRQKVQSMKTQGSDLFVTTKDGEIIHYRMTVERL